MSLVDKYYIVNYVNEIVKPFFPPTACKLRAIINSKFNYVRRFEVYDKDNNLLTPDPAAIDQYCKKWGLRSIDEMVEEDIKRLTEANTIKFVKNDIRQDTINDILLEIIDRKMPRVDDCNLIIPPYVDFDIKSTMFGGEGLPYEI